MSKKEFKTGVYIDGSNLFWAQRILLKNPELPSWKLDHTKLKKHLDDKYSPLFFKYYATVDVAPSNDVFAARAAGEARFRGYLGHLGYEVITKPLKYITDRRTGKTITKGDTDVEVTQGVNNTLSDVELICLITGDSDFMVALKDWYAAGKYIQIYSYRHIMASEIRDFCYATPGCSFTFLDDIRDEVEMTT
jgi:uncharacterized LabA/DUF88 family protein